MTEENGDVKELPKGWVEVSLKDLFTPNRPRVSPQEYPDLPFIGMEHISPHTMQLLGTEIAKNMKSSSVYFYRNDVLYGRLRPYLNKVYKPDFEGLCSAEFIVFPQIKWVNEKYIQYLLNSAKFVSFASHLNEGDRPRVDFNAIGSYKFFLPPLDEQERIVEKIEELFSDIDRGIESLKTAQKQLKVYRQAVLKWAFEGKLTEEWRKQHSSTLKTGEALLAQIKAERENRYQQQLTEWEEKVREWEAIGKVGKKPTKPRKPEEATLFSKSERSPIPSSWCWVKLEDITDDIFDGPFGSNLKTEDYVDEGVRVIRLENIEHLNFDNAKKTFISREKYKTLERHTVYKGDIIFSSFINEEIRATILPNLDTTAIAKADCFCIRNKNNLINQKWLVYLLSSRNSYNQLIIETHGFTRPRINTTQLKQFVVPLCPSSEQEQIVQEIESRLSICDQLEATIIENLQKAEALRQSILKQAFEGKLVPQDPSDEPAEKLLEQIRTEKAQSQTVNRRGRSA